MTRDDLIKSISKALDVSYKKINDNTNNENLEEWDSLGHLAILSAIDKSTNGKASGIETLSSCTSFRELLKILKKNNLVK